MKMKMKKVFENNFEYIKPLHKISVIFGVAPPYNFKSGQISANLAYKTFLILAAAFNAVVYLKCIWELSTSPILNTTSKITQHISLLASVLISLKSLLQMFLGKYKTWKLLFGTFAFVDKNLHMKHEKNGWTFVLVLLTGYAVITGTILHKYVLAFINVPAYFQFIIIKMLAQIQHLSAFTMVLMMGNIALSIKYRFQAINERFRNVYNVQDDFKFRLFQPSMASVNKTSNILDLKHITYLYASVSDLVDYCNDIFNWQIFFLFVLAFIKFLEVFHFYVILHSVHAETMVFNLIVMVIINLRCDKLEVLNSYVSFCCY